MLPANGTVKLPLLFRSRFSKPVSSILTLVSKRVGASQPSAIVFKLTSEVTDLKPLEVLSCKTRCYEPITTKIHFSNTSEVMARFEIVLQQERLGEIVGSQEAKARWTAGGSEDQADPNLAPFWCRIIAELDQSSSNDKLELAPGESVVIPITFLPFNTGRFRCHVRLTDERVGEYVYEVCGDALLPLPTETRKWSTEVNVPLEQSFVVAEKNSGLERAKNAVVERLRQIGMDPAKLREHTQVCFFTLLLSVFHPNSQALRASLGDRTYRAEYVLPAVKGADRILQGPEEVSCLVSARDGDSNRNTTPKSSFALALKLQPQEQGIFLCRIILRSPYDVRVLEVEGTGTPPAQHAQLELSVPAGSNVVQK